MEANPDQLVPYGIFLLAGIAVFAFWISSRVLHKMGRSAWWGLVIFVPVVNIIALWVVAFVRWPALDATAGNNGPRTNP